MKGNKIILRRVLSRRGTLLLEPARPRGGPRKKEAEVRPFPKDPLLYTKYIGAVSVLGAISTRALTSDEVYSRDRALEDANVILSSMRADIRFVKGVHSWQSQDVKKEKRP